MNADFVTMIGNLSQSLLPVQALITGFGYLIGLIFILTAISKLKKIGDHRARGGSNEKMFVPIAYFLSGSAMIFLPSTLKVLTNTAFGTGSNILEYANYNPYDIYGAMRIVIRTAGLIWFIRGCVLIAHASQPGVQDGPKGLAFLVAGLMAVNFDYTMSMIDYSFDRLVQWM